jgi:hypothetical protein
MSAEHHRKEDCDKQSEPFLAIRELLTAYGIPVRRATGFPISQGVLDALFEDNQEVLQEAMQI